MVKLQHFPLFELQNHGFDVSVARTEGVTRNAPLHALGARFPTTVQNAHTQILTGNKITP